MLAGSCRAYYCRYRSLSLPAHAPTALLLQEMPVVTHAMVPCGHSFCGECLAEWLSKKPECPTCRCGRWGCCVPAAGLLLIRMRKKEEACCTPVFLFCTLPLNVCVLPGLVPPCCCRKAGEAAPLRNHDMDRMIDMLVSLSAQGAGLVSRGWAARSDLMALQNSRRPLPCCQPMHGTSVEHHVALLASQLSDGDLEARKQRMATWESKRTELEAKLAAPWARGARRGGGGGGGGAAGGRLA